MAQTKKMKNKVLVLEEVKDPEWFKTLIGDCRAIIVESEFTSRYALVEGYHQLGERIMAEHKNFERAKIYGKDIVSTIATSLGKSQRTIWYALQFVKKYPDLDKVPEGKAVSWRSIVNKYLPDSEKNKQDKEFHEHEWEQRLICKKCGLVKAD